MRYGPKKDRSPLTRIQRLEHRQNLQEQRQVGTGRYKFRNNTAADLGLPKPAEDGRRAIPAKGEFIGDSYFLSMIPQLLVLVEDLNMKNESKLILDQPPVVTSEGTVEYIQQPKQQKFNESKPGKQEDTLLVEDPVGGVVIVE
jgi:hypothetical protein